jgi:hypothetical protein
MTIDAEQIANRLQQKENLLRVVNYGNTMIWFLNRLPDDLVVGSRVRSISSGDISLPHHHYYIPANTLNGGMSFWKHLGPMCMAAGAFISISPLYSGKPIATIELVEAERLGSKELTEDCTLWVHEFQSSDDLPFLCKGIFDGLAASYINHPLADINIKILKILTHRVESSSKAFEVLGNYIIETMIFELYKRDWLKGPYRKY